MSLVPVLLGVFAAVGEPAVAEVQEMELRWQAPAGCPSSEDVREEIAALLGPGEALDEPLVAQVEVEEHADGYELRLELTTRTGRDVRRLRGPQCQPLARATALVVATLLDPVAVSDHIEDLERRATDTPVASPPPTPSTIPEAPVEEPPDDPPALGPSAVTIEPRSEDRTASPRRRLRPRPSLRLEGLVGTAALPRIDGGLALAAGLVAPRLRLELGASHVFAQPRAHPDLADVGLRIRATTGQVRACGVPSLGRWEFPLCLAGDVGAMAARGEGSAVVDPTLERSFYAAALAEVHGAWRATERIGLWLGAQGVLNLTRPSFTVDTLEPFFSAPVGGVRAKLGVEVRFP